MVDHKFPEILGDLSLLVDDLEDYEGVHFCLVAHSLVKVLFSENVLLGYCPTCHSTSFCEMPSVSLEALFSRRKEGT